MKVSEACTYILAQLSQLLDKLSPEEYTRPAKVLNENTIGQHLRHTLEFFICLEHGSQVGIVNYDKRNHDKLIESDKFIAIATIGRIRTFVENHRDDILTLEASYGNHEDHAIRVNTSLTRELVYNIEHAVHHMAIMKIAIREIAPALELPADFGIASSTLRYAAASKQASQYN